MAQQSEGGCLSALIGLALIFGLVWLLSPKSEQELNDHLRRRCERRGGVFYDQNLGNGVHQICHGVD